MIEVSTYTVGMIEVRLSQVCIYTIGESVCTVGMIVVRLCTFEARMYTVGVKHVCLHSKMQYSF